MTRNNKIKYHKSTKEKNNKKTGFLCRKPVTDDQREIIRRIYR